MPHRHNMEGTTEHPVMTETITAMMTTVMTMIVTTTAVAEGITRNTNTAGIITIITITAGTTGGKE